MTGSLAALAVAACAFVASHVVLSALPIRSRLVAAVGERSFRAGYSLLAAALLVWLVMAYAAAPFVELWQPPPGLRHLSLLLMALACVLLVAGLTTRGPRADGAGGPDGAGSAAHPLGIYRVTRHPAMWAIGLWSVAHLLANGDLAAVLLFSAMAALALAGALNSDHRRQARLGGAWAAFRAQTSFVPFQAILTGRTALRMDEIGWARLAGGIALFVALLFAHPWLIGVSPLPG